MQERMVHVGVTQKRSNKNALGGLSEVVEEGRKIVTRKDSKSIALQEKNHKEKVLCAFKQAQMVRASSNASRHMNA